MTIENVESAGANGQSQKKNAPIQMLRHKGAFIKLWQQEGENGPFVTATVGKTYKDKATGEFKEGYSLSENDLGKIDLIMPEARTAMAAWHNHYRQQQQQNVQHPQNGQSQQSPERDGQQRESSTSSAPNVQHDMAASRNEALRQAAPDQAGPGQMMDREPSSGISR